MSELTVARRYARALYEEAEAGGEVDRIDQDVAVLQETLSGSPDLQRLLRSPVVPRARKQAVVRRLFEGKLSETVVSLLGLLVQKGREGLLPEVVAAYERLRLERVGQVEAHVRSAMPLDDDELQHLQTVLSQSTGRNVVLRTEVDPGLLSGLVVKLGDVVHDGTGRHHLKTLREQFAARKYLSN